MGRMGTSRMSIGPGYEWYREMEEEYRTPGPYIKADEWTDDEWIRVIAEFPPETDPVVAEQAVAQWRKEAERR